MDYYKSISSVNYINNKPKIVLEDGLSDMREDSAFTNRSSREVDIIDPEDCVSTMKLGGRIGVMLKNHRRVDG